MKPIVLLLGFVLAAGAGALGGSLVASRPGANGTAEPVQAPTAVAPAVSALPPEVKSRLDELAMEVATLEHKLAQMAQNAERAPAASTTPATTEANAAFAAANLSTEQFAALHRDAILKVIDDERVAQEKQRETEARERQRQQDLNQATRVAEKLQLSEGQKQQLVDFYGVERQRMQDMRTQMRDGAVAGGPDNPRDAFRELREWHTNELTRLFGTDLGARIDEADGDRGRALAGGRRGFNGGGGAGAGGAGGGDGAGGAGTGGTPQGNRGPRAPRGGG